MSRERKSCFRVRATGHARPGLHGIHRPVAALRNGFRVSSTILRARTRFAVAPSQGWKALRVGREYRKRCSWIGCSYRCRRLPSKPPSPAFSTPWTRRWQRTREAAERAQNHKRSMVQRVFTEGLYGEVQQKSPIGHIPRSWQVVPVKCVVEKFQYGLSMPMDDRGHLPIMFVWETYRIAM